MQLSEKRLRFDGRPMPIPVSEILAYVTFNQITEEYRRDLLYHIVSCLDVIYIQYYLAQAAK